MTSYVRRSVRFMVDTSLVWTVPEQPDDLREVPTHADAARISAPAVKTKNPTSVGAGGASMLPRVADVSLAAGCLFERSQVEKDEHVALQRRLGICRASAS